MCLTDLRVQGILLAEVKNKYRGAEMGSQFSDDDIARLWNQLSRDGSMEEINKLINEIAEDIGIEGLSSLIRGIKHKAHEAKYLSRCNSMQEAEQHFIQCSECLQNMPPLEEYWMMSHKMPEMQCETPFHSRDRFKVN